MTRHCSRVEELLATGEPQRLRNPPADVREHLESCRPCRSLWELGDGDLAPPSPAVEERISQALGEALLPVRPVPSRPALIAGFLTIFGSVSAAVVGFIGIRGASAMSALQLAGALAGVAVAAVLAAMALSCGMTPGGRKLMRPGIQSLLAVAVPLAAAALLFRWEFSPGWLGGTWHCFVTGFGVSIPAALLTIALLGRGAVLSWSSVGAGAGLLAGLVGATALHIGCPMTDAPHITVGHLSLPIFGSALGWLIGRFLPSVVPGPAQAETQ